MTDDMTRLPIGVFDSGVGGLTVLKALQARLPREDLLYLGDTARLPYGAKSGDTVRRYALQASKVLADRRVKLLVVACNTASAVSLEALRQARAPLPVVGVVEPGAEAGVRATRVGRVAVIATESTVRGGAYERAIRRLRPDAVVMSKACPLFVALAEEGWLSGPLVEGVVGEYLRPMFDGDPATRPDCLVLGCTHFPLLRQAIAAVVGPRTALVDSAETTALVVERELAARNLLAASGAGGRVRFLATDGAERFSRVGTIFMGAPIRPEDVEIVDL